LTIETANVVLDEQYAVIDAEVVPGQYVMRAWQWYERQTVLPPPLWRGIDGRRIPGTASATGSRGGGDPCSRGQ
jgi:hypothetical protein